LADVIWIYNISPNSPASGSGLKANYSMHCCHDVNPALECAVANSTSISVLLMILSTTIQLILVWHHSHIV